MTEQHAKLSPSSSYRRIMCPGSLLKEVAYPNTTNEWAEQGSSAHALAEKCLKAGIYEVPDEFLGVDWRDKDDIVMEFKADDAMAEAVDVYLEECREITMEIRQAMEAKGHQITSKSGSPFVEIEARLQMPGVHPELAWGTGDFVAYNPVTKTVYVRDYKHGRGLVEIELEDNLLIEFNTQLMEYAYGGIVCYRNLKNEVEEVDLGVVQPNASHKEGPVRSVCIPSQTVMDFIYNVDKPSADEALQPGARLCAGEWCKYCKAANDCEEKTGEAIATMQEGFGPVDVLATDKPVTMNLPALSQMTDEQLNNMANIFELLDSYKKLMKAEMLDRASQNEAKFKDWVLSKTNPHRKWKPEAEATLSLSYGDDDIYDKKLKSPAQMQKTLGRKAKDEIESLIFKPEGALTISAAKTTKFIVNPKEEAAEGFSATVEEK